MDLSLSGTDSDSARKPFQRVSASESRPIVLNSTLLPARPKRARVLAQLRRFVRDSDESDSDDGGCPSAVVSPVESLVNPPNSPISSDDESDLCGLVDDAVSAGSVVPAGPRVKSRAWCFTINNYTDADVHRFRDNFDSPGKIRYMVLGYETAPETGTKHIQGYMYLDNPRYGNVLRHQFGGLGHWEASKGSPTQNKTYCTKGGDFLELGELPVQGKRNDMASLAKRVCTDRVSFGDLITGGEFDAVATWMRYQRSFDGLRQHLVPKRDPANAPTVIWLHGPTGCGKSKWAWETYPDAYRWPGAGFWFDGYDGHEVIVFDDFRHDAGISFSNLLRIIDRYPMSVPIKGGFVPMAATTFVFTTPMAPENVYSTTERVTQLMRRITEVKELAVELAPIFVAGTGN